MEFLYFDEPDRRYSRFSCGGAGTGMRIQLLLFVALILVLAWLSAGSAASGTRRHSRVASRLQSKLHNKDKCTWAIADCVAEACIDCECCEANFQRCVESECSNCWTDTTTEW